MDVEDVEEDHVACLVDLDQQASRNQRDELGGEREEQIRAGPQRHLDQGVHGPVADTQRDDGDMHARHHDVEPELRHQSSQTDRAQTYGLLDGRKRKEHQDRDGDHDPADDVEHGELAPQQDPHDREPDRDGQVGSYAASGTAHRLVHRSVPWVTTDMYGVRSRSSCALRSVMSNRGPAATLKTRPTVTSAAVGTNMLIGIVDGSTPISSLTTASLPCNAPSAGASLTESGGNCQKARFHALAIA